MKKDINSNNPNSISAIDELIEQGDQCFEKDTFDGCLSALDCYINAQSKLDELAKADSTDTDIKIKMIQLNNKITDTNKKMANPKLA